MSILLAKERERERERERDETKLVNWFFIYFLETKILRILIHASDSLRILLFVMCLTDLQ